MRFLSRHPVPLLAAAVGGLLLAAAEGGTAPQRTRSQPNLILVVVDTLRADRLGSYGDTKALTPFLDRLAERGLRFERAYAPSSWTMPSVASLFTSRYPSQHLVVDFEARLADSEQTLAEQLWMAGYRTGGFTANWRLDWKNGFHQGFDTWQPLFPMVLADGKVAGDVVRDAATRWLDEDRDARRRPPTFLYLQYMEPHAPLNPPTDLRERFAPELTDAEVQRLNAKSVLMTPVPSNGMAPVEAAQLERLYGAQVAAADRELEAMFANLDRRGYLDNAVIVVTADHGEEFLEHGALGHGFDLFEETVRVPLIISGPMVKPGVAREPFSLIDLAPTLLELGAAEPEPRFEGRSRVSMLNDNWKSLLRRLVQWREPSPILLELPESLTEHAVRLHHSGRVEGQDKLLVDQGGRPALYHLDRDPGEKAPIKDGARVGELAAALKMQQGLLAGRKAPVQEKVDMDPATVERLRALGYQQ